MTTQYVFFEREAVVDPNTREPYKVFSNLQVSIRGARRGRMNEYKRGGETMDSGCVELCIGMEG
jgi:hypothetical protein